MRTLSTLSWSRLSASNWAAISGSSEARAPSTRIVTRFLTGAGKPVAADAEEELELLGAREPRVAEQVGHLRVGGDGAGEREPVGPSREILRLQRRAERRFGVGAGDGGDFGHGVS